MNTKDKLINIRWAGPNTPFIEIQRTGERFYPNKRELLSIRQAIKMFVNAYSENFTNDTIDWFDGDEWEDPVPKIREYTPSDEQVFNKNRWEELDKMLRKAGFDNEAIACTEFCIMTFFEIVVEECAKQVEDFRIEGQTGFYAADFIREYGKQLGNKKG